MKFLHNPINGAPIDKLYFKSTLYFKDEPFGVNTVIQVEDDVADFLVRIYGFLKVITKEEALELSKKPKEQFTCECGFTTTTKIALIGHKRSHANNPDYVPGIKTIVAEKTEQATEPKGEQTLKGWEEQDRALGLEGEGLTVDRV